MKLAAWLVPWRRAVNDTPRYSTLNPSSRMTVKSAWGALRYLGALRGSARLWCWACRRILTTSIGLTMATASVTPAARPATGKRISIRSFSEKGKVKYHLPMKVDLLLTLPVCLSASSCLYHSYEVNRMAILGMIPPRTAPRPLYRPRAVSFLTISTPVVTNPRGFTCKKHEKREQFARTPFNWHCTKGNSPREL